MKASLISIGCDKYQYEEFPELSGAENDATAIYTLLSNSEYAIYEKFDSIYLGSPNKIEIIQALEKVLYEKDCPDILTFFFAGHGGVFSGAYYLCVNETRIDRISLTALPLSEIFRIVSATQVKHVNLIIDACNTAGLVNDLLALIKPDLMGGQGTFGISILAAAASDEAALEVAGHGLLTASLLAIIKGEERINTYSEYLDLVSIGRAISTKFIEKKFGQTPTSWGMNLYGPSVFSKNPFHTSDNSIPTHYYSFIPSASRVGKVLAQHKSELLEAFENLEKTEGVDGFLKILRDVTRQIENSDDLITIIKGVGYRFIEKNQPSANFKQLELVNALVTLLLPHLCDSSIKSTVIELMQLFRYIGRSVLKDLNEQLEADKHYLISKNDNGFGVLANYFYLPIRLSKILGYFGQLLLVDEGVKEELNRFINLLKANYSKHIGVMSDLQSPFIYTFFKACLNGNQTAEAKPILYTYINSYLAYSGKIAKLDLGPEKAPLFLMQRYSTGEVSSDLKASPESIGGVLLLHAVSYCIDEELDMHLHNLDRRGMHIFIPGEIDCFGSEVIESGINLTPRCGFDFWTCKEFMNLFENNYSLYSNINRNEIDLTVKFSCVAASFCLPDRVPVMF